MAGQALPLIRLTEHFERLPGIGKKMAQRLAFAVLSMPEENARDFADSIIQAREKLHRCPTCQNLTDEDECSICSDVKRDKSTLCVVEDPRDVIAFERTKEYYGQYHVLHGLLSPMSGIGPEQLSIKELLSRLSGNDISEVIMATNPTVEGEATALYLAKLIKPMGFKVTRLAYGIPVGGSLEYADDITIFRALEGRNEI